MDKGQVNARLDKIRQQVDHIKGVMEDVLQLARIQTAGGWSSALPPVAWTISAGRLSKNSRVWPNIDRVHLNCLFALPPTFFDQRLLRQVFVDLLSRSFDTPPGNQSHGVDPRAPASGAACKR